MGGRMGGGAGGDEQVAVRLVERLAGGEVVHGYGFGPGVYGGDFVTRARINGMFFREIPRACGR